MQKIVIIANDTTTLYNFRYEVIQSIIEHGFKVTAICTFDKHVEDIKKLGCELVPINISRHGKNPLQDVGLYKEIYRLLKELSPDVVCTYNIKPNVYGGMACARLAIPYIVNVCGLGTPVETPGIMQVITCFLYRLGVKKAACVFFQNEENKAFFENRKMLSGRSRVLCGSGVNLEKWKCLPYPHDKSVDFIFVARVMKEKGIEQYLGAAREITKRYREARFHVIGACEEPVYLEQMKAMQEEGILLYHGWESDISPFQALNCCTVHPTYYPEGISNVLLESAASGRPIITTGRSGCREIVDDGVNGFICKQRDTRDLIDKIERFLALSWEERRDMGLAGRKKVEREFDRQIVVQEYLEELNC